MQFNGWQGQASAKTTNLKAKEIDLSDQLNS